MKIKNKKSFSIKKLIIPALLIIALGGGAYAYALSNNFFSANTPSDQSSDFVSPNDPVPDGPNPTDDTDKENLGEETAPPAAGDRAVTITAASVSSDTLQIRALIQGVVSGDTCSLSVVQNGAVVLSETAEVQPGPSSSTCQGFDVNVASLSAGALSITVAYVNNGTASTSAVRTVELSR